jgi:PAS domain S-box-containing protein
MKKTLSTSVNEEFQTYYLTSSLLFMKRGFGVTIFLFVLIAISTKILFPHSPSIEYLLRFGVIIPIMILSLVTVYIGSLRSYLHLILTSSAITSSLVVFFVGAFSDIHKDGYHYYFVWVMLVLIGTITFYRIRLFNIIIIGALIILAYILATIINHNFSEDPLGFVNNLFFVLAIASVCYFVAISSHRLIYNNFLHRKELNEKNEKLEIEIGDRLVAEMALMESEKNYKDSLEAIPDWIHVVDKELRFVFMNTQFREINKSLGLDTDIHGKHITEVFPFIPEGRTAEYEKVFKKGELFIVEEVVTVNGVDFFTETRLIPIYKDNKVTQIITVIRDIGKKKEIESLKLKNAEQKEILLREIHHRVKNNLAIVISLMDMQIRNNPNPAFIKMARDVEFRIRSMALIHEHLYKSDELDRVPFEKYIHSLAVCVAGAFGNGNIKLGSILEQVDVSIEMAMPLGLIANEILTNACKYAFRNREEGEITIELKGDDTDSGSYCLTIKDDGVGLPEGFSLEEPTSLGMLIIKLLIEQINAKLIIENHHGTSFSIFFKGIRSEKQQ